MLGNKVLIRTDHHSLKYLLDQRVTTTNQQKWITKLIGLDYEIVYKKGKENMVADCLSRQVDNTSSDHRCLAISQVVPRWILELAQSWESDANMRDLVAQL